MTLIIFSATLLAFFWSDPGINPFKLIPIMCVMFLLVDLIVPDR